MKISEFQRLMEEIYGEKDGARGVLANFLWFSEEVGELARALNGRGDRANLEEEFADVFAWLCSLASLSGVELEKAVQKYAHGCPRCQSSPCDC